MSPEPFYSGPTVPVQETLNELSDVLFWRSDSHSNMDPYREQVQALASDPTKFSQFFTLVDSYLRQWRYIPPSRLEKKSYYPRVLECLRNHPHTTVDEASITFPLAAIFDIANRSPVGLYQQRIPAVTTFSDKNAPQFYTLSHNPVWCNLLGELAVEQFRYLTEHGKTDLIMIGDGSGEIGAQVAKALLSAGLESRIIHVDASRTMLSEQRQRYQAQGLESKNIVSVHCDALNSASRIRGLVPDLQRAFIVVHEVLDDLRTHVLFSREDEVTEIYGTLDKSKSLRNGPRTPSHDLLGQLPSFLPFCAGKEQGMYVPFSVESVALLRELRNIAQESIVYVGDYCGAFSLGAYQKDFERLPIRSFAIGVQEDDIGTFLRVPTNVTADVNPSLFHLVEGLNGSVVHLGTQDELFDSVLLHRKDTAIEYLQGILDRGQDKKVISQEENIFLQFYSPLFFGALLHYYPTAR